MEKKNCFLYRSTIYICLFGTTGSPEQPPSKPLDQQQNEDQNGGLDDWGVCALRTELNYLDSVQSNRNHGPVPEDAWEKLGRSRSAPGWHCFDVNSIQERGHLLHWPSIVRQRCRTFQVQLVKKQMLKKKHCKFVFILWCRFKGIFHSFIVVKNQRQSPSGVLF